MNVPNFSVKEDMVLLRRDSNYREIYLEIRGASESKFVLLHADRPIPERYRKRWTPLRHIIKIMKMKRVSRLEFEGEQCYIFD